jgi:ATP-dependent DNA helicase RecQ
MCDVCGNSPEWLTEAPEEALAVKTKRQPKMVAAAGDQPPADGDLVEYFKEWRWATAQRSAVPAYIVLNDASLQDLCRKQPANVAELLAVTGIGERKAELYGNEIFAAFSAWRNGARATVRAAPQSPPAEETLRLLAEGKNFEEIAQIRGRQVSTVVTMVADLVEKGALEYRMEWVGDERHRQIEEAARRLGTQYLRPLREALPEETTYDQIKLVVAFVRRQGSQT